MRVFAITVTSTSILMAWTAVAAFTVDHRVRNTPALMPKVKGFGPQPWVSSNDGVKRSMVAKEPEAPSGSNSEKDFDKLKPNMSIVKPEDLIKEMNEANGFSEWQGTHIPTEEMLNNEEEEVDIDAMVQEVEDVLADDAPVVDQVKANVEVSIEERAVEKTQKKEDDVDSNSSTVDSATPAAAAAIAAAHKSEERFANKQQLAKQSVLFRVLNRVLSPIFGRAIEKNVPKTTIKGSWISGAFISLVGGLDPITSLFVATGLSYVSITPGVAGGIARAAGEATWDTGLIALKVAKNISAALGVETSLSPAVESNIGVATQETDVGEDIKSLVREVEETVAEVESVLQSTTDARDVWEAEETAERLAEEARHAEIEYLLEEARIEKESQEFEKEFLAEEARIAEDEKVAEEARLEEEATLDEEDRLAELARVVEEERIVEEARLVEEQRLSEETRVSEERRLAEYAQLAEEQRIAEKTRIGEEKRIAEEARLAEEVRITEEQELIAEEARLAEEAKLAEEEDEIDDEDWQASIQLAEGLSTDFNGAKGNWDAARQLAKDLVDEPEDEPIDFNAPGLSDERRMELIGDAARAAVEKFEAAKQEEEELEVQEKSRRNEMKSILRKEGINGLDTEPEAQPVSQQENTEVLNYEKMTVVLLKDALRSRGLKMSGRKAELIARLRADDA